MKKLSLALAGVFFALSMVACKSENTDNTGNSDVEVKTTEKIAHSSPEEILKKHLDAYYLEDYKTSYAYISKKDHDFKSLGAYLKEKNEAKASFDLKRIYDKPLGYTLESTEIKEDTAKAKIIIDMPDIEKMTSEVLLAVAMQAQGKSDEQGTELLYEAINKKYQDKKPMIKVPHEVNLVKENEGWRVFFDWANPEKSETNKSKTYGIGEEGTLMSSPTLGNVDFKVNSVRYVPNPKSKDQLLAILDVDVINKLNEKHYDFMMGFYSTAIFSKGGNKYPLSFEYIKGISPEVKKSSPDGTVNPGKRINGEIVFEIDKDSTELVLVMDAGNSPKKEGVYESGKELRVKLDK